MKIKIQGYANKLHSWAVVHQALATEWIKQGHSVDIFSTDGGNNIPNHLKNNLIGYVNDGDQKKVFGRLPDKNYDMQFSYTAMKNAKNYLQYGSKNRFHVWCYEWVSTQNKDILPTGFSKEYKNSDLLLAPSTYVRDLMFVPAKIPSNHIKVVPHGINPDAFRNKTYIKMPTNKTFKILVNLAQTHLRKNIQGILAAYGKAFTNEDDVCLIFKAKNKKATAPFEVSIGDEINKFKLKFKHHAEVKLFEQFLPDISSLYHSVDCLFSLSNGEGFLLPGLEALAAGKLVIAPTLGGHRDFVNENNGLLVDSEFGRANPKAMYWNSNSYAEHVVPNEDHAALQLKEAYKTYIERNQAIELQQEYILENYSWDKISKQIIGLCI